MTSADASQRRPLSSNTPGSRSTVSPESRPEPLVIRETWWYKYAGLVNAVFLLPLGVMSIVHRSKGGLPPMFDTIVGAAIIVLVPVMIWHWFVERRRRDGVMLSVVDDVLSCGPRVDSRSSIPLAELRGVAWQNDRTIAFVSTRGRFLVDFMFVRKANREKFRRYLSSRLDFYRPPNDREGEER